MNEHEVRVFTLEEANKLIPSLSKLIKELQVKRDKASTLEAQIDAMELISGTEPSKPRKELDRLMESHRKVLASFHETVELIHENGCYLKDVNNGLVDFFGIVDGRMVCLCWRMGERKIRFWHDIHVGFDGRQPLNLD